MQLTGRQSMIERLCRQAAALWLCLSRATVRPEAGTLPYL
jgi:hypothetical protein